MWGKEHSRKSDRTFKVSEVKRGFYVRGYGSKKLVPEWRLEKQEGVRRSRIPDQR